MDTIKYGYTFFVPIYSSTAFEYTSRFNRTYREELLDLYIFESLEEVREKTYWWKIAYNEERPHDALGHMTPAAYLENHTGNSNFDLST